MPTSVAALDSSHNCPDQTIVLARLLSVRFRLYRVPLAVDRDGLEINYKVVVLGDSNDQFDAGTPRNRQSPVAASDILIHHARVNLVASSLNVDCFVGANGYD